MSNKFSLAIPSKGIKSRFWLKDFNENLAQGYIKVGYPPTLLNQLEEVNMSSIVYMVVTFTMCLYGLYLYGKTFKLEDIDQYLSKENQEYLLKNCYYDHSFKKNTLQEIEIMIHRINAQLMDLNKDKLIIKAELSSKIDNLKALKHKILVDSYNEKLAELSPDQRALDDWDRF